MMQTLMLGAIAMASLVAALFFFRFWRKTRDRFFLLFALAFLVDSLHRAVLGAVGNLAAESEPFFYLVRLVVFGLILAAIVDKNTRRR
jgi:hypothetical protein